MIGATAIGGKTAVDLGNTRTSWVPSGSLNWSSWTGPLAASPPPLHQRPGRGGQGQPAGRPGSCSASLKGRHHDGQINEIIYRSLRFKKNIVRQDETGRRMRRPQLRPHHRPRHRGRQGHQGPPHRKACSTASAWRWGCCPMIESRRCKSGFGRSTAAWAALRTTYNKKKVLARCCTTKRRRAVRSPSSGAGSGLRWRAETIPVEGLRPLLGSRGMTARRTRSGLPSP